MCAGKPCSSSRRAGTGRKAHPRPRAPAPRALSAARWRRCGCRPAPPGGWPGGRRRPGRVPPAAGGERGMRAGQGTRQMRAADADDARQAECVAFQRHCTWEQGTTARRAPRSPLDFSHPSHSSWWAGMQPYSHPSSRRRCRHQPRWRLSSSATLLVRCWEGGDGLGDGQQHRTGTSSRHEQQPPSSSKQDSDSSDPPKRPSLTAQSRRKRPRAGPRR